MLIDGQIRNRLVSLADTVEEAPIDDAFHAVVQGAAARRKRDIATRSAIAATALCVVAAGAAFSWSWPTSGEVTEPVPADRIAPIEAEPDPELRHEDRRRTKEESRRPRSGAAVEGRSPEGSKAKSRSNGRDQQAHTVSGATPIEGAAGISGTQEVREPEGGGSQEGSLRLEETHSQVEPYQPSFVSANPDRRSGCSLDGQSCGSFFNQPGDAFASVSVADEAGTVFVRITQWDRHGRRVGEPLTYCGGESQTFALAPDITHVSVSVEKGVCGGVQTTPAGGHIETSFFKQVP